MDANVFINGVTKDRERLPLSIVDYGVDISENQVGSGGGGARNGQDGHGSELGPSEIIGH